MTKYSHPSTAEFAVQVGKRKERCSGFKMLSQIYLYWDFICFLPCRCSGGHTPRWHCRDSCTLKFPFHSFFFCLPCMFTAGVDTQSNVHHWGAWKRREVKFSRLEQAGSKFLPAQDELCMDLLTDTLHCGTWGGMGGGTIPPGVWEGLRAGKQILDVISAGSHILECRWGKKFRFKF